MARDAPIISLINFLLERGHARRIISVGGLSALALPLASSEIERQHIDPGSLDFLSNADLVQGAIVLCLNTFDSIADPQPLLHALARNQDRVDFIIFCVQDRVRHCGLLQDRQSAGAPRWTAETFAQALQAAGFAEHCLMGYVSERAPDEPKKSFLVIAGREAAPANLDPGPARLPSVAAIINTYNEADVIEPVVRYLAGQDIAVHVRDNWSTDGTYEKCERLLEAGACASLDRFPAAPSDQYDWTAQLNNTAQLAAELHADWVLHYDADEIRCAPWQGMSLRQGIGFVDSLGYNAIDFTVLNFFFTEDGSPDEFKADQLPFFEFGRDPPYFSQVKAWRNKGQVVDLSSTGGHEAIFADRMIFPLKFLTKHYSLRSRAQATRKIFTDRLPRISSERQRLGWHTHYDFYAQARVIEPWHPWELQRFDEASFYIDNLLEAIAGIGIARSTIVLPNRRTMVHVAANLSAAVEEQSAHANALGARIAELESAYARRIADPEQSLFWRVLAPFRGGGRAVRSLSLKHHLTRLGALLRHPLSSRKRKLYRAQRMSELASGERVLSAKRRQARLHAFLRHPRSSAKRKIYRERLMAEAGTRQG